MLAVKPATTKQIAYIERLLEESGDSGPKVGAETTSTEASKIIQRLVSRQNGDINEPRLGMAMKECFRHFTSLGRDLWDEKRELFIERTIETYNLFTEIHDKLDPSFNQKE